MEQDVGIDDRNLERFGYHPELKRELGPLSSFALSFSVISVTTGLFANYGDGLRAAGPAFIWTWLIVGCGQFVVALVFARLARSIPLSGYAYQWTRHLAGPRAAWWAGWMMVVQFLTGLPGVCYALANYLVPYTGLKHSQGSVVVLTLGALVVIALINHFGIRLASRVNYISVAAEILGTGAVGLILLEVVVVRRTHPWGFLLSHPQQPSGFHYLGAFAFSSVMSAWTLTGFEGAANMAEETRQPERRVPAAILYSEVSSVVLGFLVLVGFTLAIPSLDSIAGHSTPLVAIMAAYFPPLLIHSVMLFVFISIFACALANMTTLTRMVWAMARDQQIPASRWLARVNKNRVPANAIWAVTLLSGLFVLWAKAEIVITGTATLAGYITYFLVVGGTLGNPNQPAGNSRQAESKRPIPRALSLIALVWLAILLAMLSLPRSAWRNSAAALTAAAVGAIYFFFAAPTAAARAAAQDRERH